MNKYFQENSRKIHSEMTSLVVGTGNETYYRTWVLRKHLPVYFAHGQLNYPVLLLINNCIENPKEITKFSSLLTILETLVKYMAPTRGLTFTWHVEVSHNFEVNVADGKRKRNKYGFKKQEKMTWHRVSLILFFYFFTIYILLTMASY